MKICVFQRTTKPKGFEKRVGLLSGLEKESEREKKKWEGEREKLCCDSVDLSVAKLFD